MSAGIAQMVQGKLCDKKGMFWWSTELSRGAPKIGMFWRFCNAISSGIKSLGQKNEVCSTPADHEPTSQNGRDFKAQFLTKMENLFRAVARLRYFMTCSMTKEDKSLLGFGEYENPLTSFRRSEDLLFLQERNESESESSATDDK